MALKTLHKPKSTLIQQGDTLYQINATWPSRAFIGENKMVDKTKLGLIVKWEGGDHVIQYQDKYHICEEIQDAEYEDIQD